MTTKDKTTQGSKGITEASKVSLEPKKGALELRKEVSQVPHSWLSLKIEFETIESGITQKMCGKSCIIGALLCHFTFHNLGHVYVSFDRKSSNLAKLDQ